MDILYLGKHMKGIFRFCTKNDNRIYLDQYTSSEQFISEKTLQESFTIIPAGHDFQI